MRVKSKIFLIILLPIIFSGCASHKKSISESLKSEQVFHMNSGANYIFVPKNTQKES